MGIEEGILFSGRGGKPLEKEVNSQLGVTEIRELGISDFLNTEIITIIPDSLRGRRVVFNQALGEGFDFSSTSSKERPYGLSINDILMEALIAGDCFRQAKAMQQDGVYLVTGDHVYEDALMQRLFDIAGYSRFAKWPDTDFRHLSHFSPEESKPRYELDTKQPIAMVYGSSGKQFALETFQELQGKGKGHELMGLDTRLEGEGKRLNINFPEEVNLKGRDVYFVQCFYDPTQPEKSINDNLLEAILFAYHAKKEGAGRVVGVFPHFAYDRQDWRNGREPISVGLVADLLYAAGYDEVLTFALHSPSSEGVFYRKFYTDIIPAEAILIPALREVWGEDWHDWYISSCDAGGSKWAKNVAQELGAFFNVGSKMRAGPQRVAVFNYLNQFRDAKNICLIDDSIAAGGTTSAAIEKARSRKAEGIRVAVIHPYMNRDLEGVSPFDRLKDVPMVITNSVPHSPGLLGQYPNITVYSLSPLAAEAIHRIHNDGSLRDLYPHK